MVLTATKWSTVEDKEKFLKHFERFVASGYKRTLFYKWFYIRLSMMFGFIAHYNINGFYAEYFADDGRQAIFENYVRTWHCYGDPEYTFSDVEHILRARINFIPKKK